MYFKKFFMESQPQPSLQCINNKINGLLVHKIECENSCLFSSRQLSALEVIAKTQGMYIEEAVVPWNIFYVFR